MASKMYGNLVRRAFNGEVDWDTHTIKVALVGSGYSPNQDTHQTWSDVVANEVGAGTAPAGYTNGGAALSGKTIQYDAASNTTVLDADDVTWANSTITARYAVIYDDNGAGDTDKVLLGYVDFGVDQASTNGNFTITWDASGIFRFTVA